MKKEKESIKEVIISTVRVFGVLIILSMGVVLIVHEIVNNHRSTDQITIFNQPDIIE